MVGLVPLAVQDNLQAAPLTNISNIITARLAPLVAHLVHLTQPLLTQTIPVVPTLLLPHKQIISSLPTPHLSHRQVDIIHNYKTQLDGTPVTAVMLINKIHYSTNIVITLINSRLAQYVTLIRLLELIHLLRRQLGITHMLRLATHIW